jgi:hypothetical protein
MKVEASGSRPFPKAHHLTSRPLAHGLWGSGHIETIAGGLVCTPPCPGLCHFLSRTSLPRCRFAVVGLGAVGSTMQPGSAEAPPSRTG